MLIKVTNYCSMGCSHCMENSTVAGEHMTRDVFARALDLSHRLEARALDAGCPPLLLLSGGECTEHPDIAAMIAEVIRQGWIPLLITNGMWLGNDELRASILRREWPRMFVQVTNDPRFYPTAPPRFDDSRITYVDSLTHLLPLGRLKLRKAPLDLPVRGAPSSFNLRSATRSLGDVRAALAVLRAPTRATPAGKQCSPSFSSNGELVAGESGMCFVVGNVDSSPEQITRNLIAMNCNRCGLVDGLTQEQKVAIGEARIVLR